MKILAIETSCDDTSIAYIDQHQIVDEVLLSSTNLQSSYGGIVPEIAARMHEENLMKCLNQLIKKNHLNLNDFTYIAYTATPGLPGSLHVGKVFAKALAYLLNKPLIPINHMLGHAFSFSINEQKKIQYPFIACTISGGHSSIYLFSSIDQYQILNETTDDAVGETLDKIGRVLGFAYPGGVSLDENYDQNHQKIKLINHYQPEESFSFSGIKTFITNLVNQKKMKNLNFDQKNLGSNVLKWCIDEILIKVQHYANKYQIKTIVFGGGVSANQLLRKSVKKLDQFTWYFPEKKHSVDNASMIANYADLLLQQKR